MAMDIYWDSCTFIHLLAHTTQYLPALDETVKQARAGKCLIHTSMVTLVEVCKLPDVGMLPIEQTEKILDFFKNEYVRAWQADRPICHEAHHLMRHHPLLPMDAIHIATALRAKVSLVVSTDTKKFRRNGLLSLNGKIGNPPLRIELPNLGVFQPLLEKLGKAESESKDKQENA